jgi:hypothetical protein
MLMALGSAAASAAAAAGPALASASAAVGAAGANALGAGSTILSAGGSLLEGVAAKNAADYNARVADFQAQQSAQQGALAGSEAIRQMNQRTAGGRAAAAESGFENSGSVNDLLQQVERAGQLDMLTAVYDGRTRALAAKSTAAMQRASGDNALWGGVVGAGAQALSGMSDYYKRQGALQLTV